MLEFLNVYVFGAVVPIALLLTGVYFTFRLKGFFILHPVKTVRKMLGGGRRGGMSPFRTTMMALAGTLGVGNIVGVASAIAVGGFGSVFWMIVSALAAMVLKYAEVVLAVKHRRYDKEGDRFYGGAPYYIKECFEKRGHLKIGVAVAGVFTVFCLVNSLTMGCVIQVNAASHALEGVFGVPLILTGGLLGVLCLICVSGGAKWVSALSGKLVPIMSAGFLFLSLAVIAARPGESLNAVKIIFADAFDLGSIGGGVMGFVSSRAIRAGCMRGLLSNEAGCGTATLAHAAADTDSPERQGLWGIFEVFVDTVVLCSVTAVAIIVGWEYAAPLTDNPIMMTVEAYSGVIGRSAGGFLAVAVLFFGFATLICWGNYGIECVRFLFGGKKGIFRGGYIMIYCATAIIGSMIAPNAIWGIADLALGVMTVINLCVILFMRKEVLTTEL